MKRLSYALLLFAVIVFLLNGCTESLEDGLPGNDSDSTTYHSTGWKDNPQHGNDFSENEQNCKACHGEDLKGGALGISCEGCHHGWSGTHADAFNEDPDTCLACHGGSITTCEDCHHSENSAFECSDCHTRAATSYTDSAHGNTLYGVNRSGTGYTQGDCIHCHDLFGGSTNDLLLFAPINPTSQIDNFCFQCHKVTGSVQTSMPQQYSYSYRASGDVSITCPSNILEAFSFIDGSGSSVPNCGSTYGTSHMLADIQNFITGKWGYTADSNPCAACHNPHRTQRDPHTSVNRGWPVSRPTDHNTSTWELWGDDLDERMNQYSTYQAPNAVSGYEPDGSGTQDGSNLTDYVTFCTDCHNSTNLIFSNVLNRELKTIDWNNEKHGGGVAGDGTYGDVLSPYQDTQCGSYILACTDCHEPHGSPNIFLTRQKVNNGTVSVTTGSANGGKEWENLCKRCHDKLSHLPDDGPHDSSQGCETCHPVGGGNYLPCTNCHFHGGDF